MYNSGKMPGIYYVGAEEIPRRFLPSVKCYFAEHRPQSLIRNVKFNISRDKRILEDVELDRINSGSLEELAGQIIDADRTTEAIWLSDTHNSVGCYFVRGDNGEEQTVPNYEVTDCKFDEKKNEFIVYTKSGPRIGIIHQVKWDNVKISIYPYKENDALIEASQIDSLRDEGTIRISQKRQLTLKERRKLAEEIKREFKRRYKMRN